METLPMPSLSWWLCTLVLSPVNVLPLTFNLANIHCSSISRSHWDCLLFSGSDWVEQLCSVLWNHMGVPGCSQMSQVSVSLTTLGVLWKQALWCAHPIHSTHWYHPSHTTDTWHCIYLHRCLLNNQCLNKLSSKNKNTIKIYHFTYKTKQKTKKQKFSTWEPTVQVWHW